MAATEDEGNAKADVLARENERLDALRAAEAVEDGALHAAPDAPNNDDEPAWLLPVSDDDAGAEPWATVEDPGTRLEAKGAPPPPDGGGAGATRHPHTRESIPGHVAREPSTSGRYGPALPRSSHQNSCAHRGAWAT